MYDTDRLGLAKSQSRCDMLKSPTSETPPSQIPIRATETKKSETDLHWEELLATSTRVLQLCDLDFSDLRSDDDNDVLAPASSINGIPPPPPPCGVPPPVPSVPKAVPNKGKKTVKLFWKVRFFVNFGQIWRKMWWNEFEKMLQNFRKYHEIWWNLWKIWENFTNFDEISEKFGRVLGKFLWVKFGYIFCAICVNVEKTHSDFEYNFEIILRKTIEIFSWISGKMWETVSRVGWILKENVWSNFETKVWENF